MTGAINISIRTIYQPPLASMAILTLYLVAVCGVAVAAKSRNIRIQFR